MTVTSSISATVSFAPSSPDNSSSNSHTQTISFSLSNSEQEELENVRKLQSKLNEIITETIKRSSTTDLLEVELDNSDEDFEDDDQ